MFDSHWLCANISITLCPVLQQYDLPKYRSTTRRVFWYNNIQSTVLLFKPTNQSFTAVQLIHTCRYHEHEHILYCAHILYCEHILRTHTHNSSTTKYKYFCWVIRSTSKYSTAIYNRGNRGYVVFLEKYEVLHPAPLPPKTGTLRLV